MSDEQTPAGKEREADEATKTAEESESGNTTENAVEAEVAPEEGSGEDSADEPEDDAKPRPSAKLERLQKILAQAGVASRRRAEQLIEEGRVQVNGKIVTELGTKADAGRDHIRVDGKLLQGAERLRYFVLNKPKGFVTTVKDPEGRPTVMQFFEKMRERLYPVGRLDYMSEGLLVVTNDGELANKLTKAASGVEKTYLVKVSGQPTEAELELLRSGVTIDRGKPGSGQVRTSPARIRQVRQGDNPWYEVVLIEGRNRELRKMFEEIGHFVEKIRRVGYGPLVLDQEPGNLRELEPDELAELRKAADGKLKTPKAKDVRRRNAMDAQLPTLPPKPSRLRPAPPTSERPAAGGAGEFRPKRSFGADRPFRQEGPASGPGQEFRPAAGRPGGRTDAGPARSGAGKFGAPKQAWKKDDRPGRPSGSQFRAVAPREGRPEADRGRPGSRRADSSGVERPSGGRSFGAKPSWKKPGTGERPAFKRPESPRREIAAAEDAPIKRVRLQIDAIEPERPSAERPIPARSGHSRPGPGMPRSVRPGYRVLTSPGSGNRDSTSQPSRSRGITSRELTGRNWTVRARIEAEAGRGAHGLVPLGRAGHRGSKANARGHSRPAQESQGQVGRGRAASRDGRKVAVMVQGLAPDLAHALGAGPRRAAALGRRERRDGSPSQPLVPSLAGFPNPDTRGRLAARARSGAGHAPGESGSGRVGRSAVDPIAECIAANLSRRAIVAC